MTDLSQIIQKKGGKFIDNTTIIYTSTHGVEMKVVRISQDDVSHIDNEPVISHTMNVYMLNETTLSTDSIANCIVRFFTNEISEYNLLYNALMEMCLKTFW